MTSIFIVSCGTKNRDELNVMGVFSTKDNANNYREKFKNTYPYYRFTEIEEFKLDHEGLLETEQS